MKKEYPQLETERQDNVLIVRLANEAARNSLTREIRYSLRDVTREIQDDYSIRAVYLTGKGETFCAGGDLRMLTEAKAPVERHRRFRHAASFMPQLMALDRPVVCGVKGYAVGGGMGLAIMADTIVAGESAKFMAGFFRLGVVPDCLTLLTVLSMGSIGSMTSRRNPGTRLPTDVDSASSPEQTSGCICAGRPRTRIRSVSPKSVNGWHGVRSLSG